jgi:hypothetical protein
LPAEDFPGDDDGMANEAAPNEYYIVIHTAYDDLYPVDIWSSEVDYMHAQDFLKALVGGSHGPEPDRRPALAQTKLHVHCMFSGISMSLPYGTVESTGSPQPWLPN